MTKQELIELCEKATKLHEQAWGIGTSIIDYYEDKLKGVRDCDNFESDVWDATEHGNYKWLIEELENLGLLSEKRKLWNGSSTCCPLGEYTLKEAKEHAIKEFSKLILDDEFEDFSVTYYAVDILDIALVTNFEDLNKIIWDELKMEFVNPKSQKYTFESAICEEVFIDISFEDVKDEIIHDLIDLMQYEEPSVQRNYFKLGARVVNCTTEKELFKIIEEYPDNWKIQKLNLD